MVISTAIFRNQNFQVFLDSLWVAQHEDEPVRIGYLPGLKHASWSKIKSIQIVVYESQREGGYEILKDPFFLLFDVHITQFWRWIVNAKSINFNPNM